MPDCGYNREFEEPFFNVLMGWSELSKLPVQFWPDLSLDAVREWHKAIVWHTSGHSQNGGKPICACFVDGYSQIEFLYLKDKELYVSDGAYYSTLEKFREFCSKYSATFRMLGPEDE